MKKALHSLGGLFVRSASALGREVLRLELCPSDTEARDFLKHLRRLGESDSFVVEVPMDMLESMTSPEEFGSREHKIALLQGNCINVNVAISNDTQDIEVLDSSPDLSYIMAANHKKGLLSATRLSTLFPTQL